MTPFQIALGVVFELPHGPHRMRVIAYDDAEVMYDVWWPHKDNWSMATLLGNVSYYRTSRDYVEANAVHIRTDPLSEKELQVLRPDLPFAVARREDASWYDASWPEGLLKAESVLDLSALYLSPFGPRDTSKPAVLLTADNGTSFTELELLIKAKALQDPFVGDVRLTEGLGIYRSGFKKRIPSYYIWGAKSRAEAPSTVLSHAARRV